MRRGRKRPVGTIYDLGNHLLELHREAGGWSMRVDGLGNGTTYRSEVEAWEAGVAVAYALNRFGATGAVA